MDKNKINFSRKRLGHCEIKDKRVQKLGEQVKEKLQEKKYIKIDTKKNGGKRIK